MLDGEYIIKVSVTYVNSFKNFPIWKFIIDANLNITYNNDVNNNREPGIEAPEREACVWRR